MEVALQTQAAELEPDVWMMYVGLRCPDPILHRLTGVCHDCNNRYFELKDKDVPVLAAFMRLACSCKGLYQIVR